MEKRLFERFKDCSKRELREFIEGLEGMDSYLKVRRVKRRGREGNLYCIYNFIDREELSFYKEREASMQFIELLAEAGYL